MLLATVTTPVVVFIEIPVTGVEVMVKVPIVPVPPDLVAATEVAAVPKMAVTAAE